MEFLRRNQLWLYFIITLVFAFSLAAVSLTTNNESITFFIPLSPSIIAIIITTVFNGWEGLREMFINLSKRFPLRWLAIALILFPILASFAILIYSFFGGPAFSTLSLNIGNLIGGSLLIPLGEEFGWHGFVLPRLLKKYSALTSSLILGVLWGFWHYAGHLLGVGVEGLHFVFLFIWILGITILMTWVFNHTKNIWIMILMHSAANATFNILPIGPSHVGRPTTFYIFIGLVWLLAFFVIFKFGPRTFVRKKTE